MSRKKVWTKTAEAIKCKYTGLKLNQAVKSKVNSRAFKKLPNGEYMSLSNKAVKQHLDELSPNEVEHEGDNFIKDTDEKVRNAKKNLGYEIE